ncbi:hypothetical protein GCM10028796_05800 [Ramlibacter monticola]
MEVLSVSCPYCSGSKEDAFETMARDRVDWTNCDSCKGKFFYLLACCDACVEESVFSWRERPSVPALEALWCNACGHVLRSSATALASDASVRM